MDEINIFYLKEVQKIIDNLHDQIELDRKRRGIPYAKNIVVYHVDMLNLQEGDISLLNKLERFRVK